MSYNWDIIGEKKVGRKIHYICTCKRKHTKHIPKEHFDLKVPYACFKCDVLESHERNLILHCFKYC
jgi:hypothetical protein